MNTKKKVLFIDDDKDFLSLMEIFFAHREFQLFIANTLTEGMFILEKENPDYVFLDNSLPDGSGWGQTEYILNHFPKTHLNLLSGYDVPKTSASSFRILEKPISLDEILSCISN